MDKSSIPIKLKINKELSIFLVCFFLATLFWLLNVYTKNYRTTLYFPVKYIHLPVDKIPVNKLPEEIAVEVYSYGLNLLSHHLTDSPDSLVIDGRELKQREVGGVKTSYISMRSIRDKVSGQLTSGMRLENFITDTIYFHFDHLVTKLVPVLPNASITFQKQYQLSGEMETQPPSILVKGPSSIVDTMQFLTTEKFNFEELNKSITQKADLYIDELPENIVLNKTVVDLHVPVEKYTEASISLPVIIEGLPDSVEIKLFPSRIECTYLVAFSDYYKVNKDLFRASVDYNKVRSHTKLKVKMEKSPQFIKFGKISPERVEYIIKRR